MKSLIHMTRVCSCCGETVSTAKDLIYKDEQPLGAYKKWKNMHLFDHYCADGNVATLNFTDLTDLQVQYFQTKKKQGSRGGRK